MKSPENLRYSKEHTWLFIDDETGMIDITVFENNGLFRREHPEEQVVF